MLDTIVVALAATSIALLLVYHVRRQQIAEFARRATHGCGSQREKAFALAATIFAEVKRGADPTFLSPVLAPLGGSPVSILRNGGCCSGVHRLYIAALDTLGIHAAQVTVYRRADPAAAHCLAQARVDGRNVLIDVDYGVWMRDLQGGGVDLAGLRSGLRPVIVPFVLDCEAQSATGGRPRGAGYPDREYYRFDYVLSRTANWAETRLKRAVYAALHPLTGGRIDLLLLPPILEWPEVLLGGALCSAAALLLLVQRFVA
jgi:hypothetical protein